MQPAKTFEELIVWQRAHQFVLNDYSYTLDIPREEVYALTSQFRRVAVSIAVNIAEDFKKRSARDKANFLNIARASLEESRYYLILSRDLHYDENAQLQTMADEVSRMLDTYRTTIYNSRRKKFFLLFYSLVSV